MYTLFQSISNTLPQTAYLKLIDLWLLFSLILPLIIFIIHMIWEMEKTKRESKANVGTAWTKGASTTIFTLGLNSRRMVQIIVPLVSALFIAVYWIYACIIYQ